MSRTHFILVASVCAVYAGVGRAQMDRIALPQRPGSIEQAWIVPATPSEATPVTLKVSLAEPLAFDTADVSQTGSMFTVRLYWTETSGAASTQDYTKSLGQLEARLYSVSVQSYVDNRLADTAHVTFRVAEAPTPGPNKNIDSVSYSPASPSAGDNVTLTVDGTWPTKGYKLGTTVLSSRQQDVTFDMHWARPKSAVAQVMTPYQQEATLHGVTEGTYSVTVRSYLDNILVDWTSLSIEVSAANQDSPDGGWPWWPWGGDWPDIGDWSGGHRGLP
jgi:hypothetical protein